MLKRVKIIFNKIPFDCWSEIIGYIHEPKDFESVILSVKGLFNFIVNVNSDCTKNIEFRVRLIPKTTKNYAHRIKVGERSIELFESVENEKKLEFDSLTRLLFERFSRISFLSFNNYKLIRDSNFSIPLDGLKFGHNLSSPYPYLRKLQVKGKSVKKHVIHFSHFPNLEHLFLLSVDGVVEFSGQSKLKKLEVLGCWGFSFSNETQVRNSLLKNLECLSFVRSTIPFPTLSNFSDNLKVLKVDNSEIPFNFRDFVYPNLKVLHLDFTRFRGESYEIRFDLFTELEELTLKEYTNGCIWFRISFLLSLKTLRIIHSPVRYLEEFSENPDDIVYQNHRIINLPEIIPHNDITFPPLLENVEITSYPSRRVETYMYGVSLNPNLKSFSFYSELDERYTIRNWNEVAKKNIEHLKIFNSSRSSDLKSLRNDFLHFFEYTSLKVLEMKDLRLIHRESEKLFRNSKKELLVKCLECFVISECPALEKLKFSGCRFEMEVKVGSVTQLSNTIIKHFFSISMRELLFLNEIILDSNRFRIKINGCHYVGIPTFRNTSMTLSVEPQNIPEKFYIRGCNNIKILRLKNCGIPEGIDKSKLQLLELDCWNKDWNGRKQKINGSEFRSLEKLIISNSSLGYGEGLNIEIQRLVNLKSLVFDMKGKYPDHLSFPRISGIHHKLDIEILNKGKLQRYFSSVEEFQNRRQF